jgi:DNA sulfur modification protein DndD
MGLQDKINEFGELRDALNREIEKQKIIKDPTILLPENSPDIPSLGRMLRTELCEVCGRKAEKGSGPWLHMEMIMNRPKTEDQIKINNFASFYGDIQRTVGSYYLNIPNISESIDNYRKELEEIESKINLRLEEYENAKFEFINAGGSENNSDINDRKNIAEHSLAEKKEGEMKENIEKAIKQIYFFDGRLKQIDEDLQSLNENAKIKDFRDFRDTMCLVEEMFNNSKDRVFDKIIKTLEIRANEKYTDLTIGNATSGGRLTFTKQADNTVQVSIKNRLDDEMTGLGNGFQRLKQLSIVMAIISSKIGNNQFNYPFISDAPFSEFGDNFINNFVDVAPKVFTQSIILIKELYDPKSKDYLNPLGSKILKKMNDGEIEGTFYVNVINEKADSTDLSTNNICYKY